MILIKTEFEKNVIGTWLDLLTDRQKQKSMSMKSKVNISLSDKAWDLDKFVCQKMWYNG